MQDKQNATDADAQQLDALIKTRDSIQNYLGGDTTESLQKQLVQQQNDLSGKKEQLRCVQSAISELLSPEHKFKFWMSGFFATLIGMVILGFFYLAGIDANIRRAIFGGQSGLQFLTLFSIVIAIILFGITSILQDKELAALLGGLSGYILGRHSTSGRRGAEDNGGAGGDDGAQDGATTPTGGGLASITVAPATASLTAASPTQQLTASPGDAQGNTLTGAFTPAWASSDVAVATVNQSGLVTFVGPGSCNVTASSGGVTSNPCAVTCA